MLTAALLLVFDGTSAQVGFSLAVTLVLKGPQAFWSHVPTILGGSWDVVSTYNWACKPLMTGVTSIWQ